MFRHKKYCTFPSFSVIFSVILRATKVVLSVRDAYKKESSGLTSFFSLFECPLLTFLLGNNYQCVKWYLHLIKFHDSFIKQRYSDILMSAMTIFLNEILL